MQLLRYDIISTITIKSPSSLSAAYKKCIQLDHEIISTSMLSKYNNIGIAKYILLEQVAIVMFNVFGYSIEAIHKICYYTIPKYTRWVKL